MRYHIYRICCMRLHVTTCNIAFVAFIACDNAGGAVLGNVVYPDDFERRVLHDVHRRRCGGGGGGRGRRRGLGGAAEPRRRRRHESAAAASAVGRHGGGGGRDATHDGAEGGHESEEEGEHATRRETV